MTTPENQWSNARNYAIVLGEKIRAKRKELGWSQPQLREQLDPSNWVIDFTVPNLSRIEQGIMLPSNAAAALLSDWLLQSTTSTKCPTCGQEQL
tara:strand:- start:323 stop:604 length:282 start_codon:yes stop_codon:yes gene_type:complete